MLFLGLWCSVAVACNIVVVAVFVVIAWIVGWLVGWCGWILWMVFHFKVNIDVSIRIKTKTVRTHIYISTCTLTLSHINAHIQTHFRCTIILLRQNILFLLLFVYCCCCFRWALHNFNDAASRLLHVSCRSCLLLAFVSIRNCDKRRSQQECVMWIATKQQQARTTTTTITRISKTICEMSFEQKWLLTDYLSYIQKMSLDAPTHTYTHMCNQVIHRFSFPKGQCKQTNKQPLIVVIKYSSVSVMITSLCLSWVVWGCGNVISHTNKAHAWRYVSSLFSQTEWMANCNQTLQQLQCCTK